MHSSKPTQLCDLRQHRPCMGPTATIASVVYEVGMAASHSGASVIRMRSSHYRVFGWLHQHTMLVACATWHFMYCRDTAADDNQCCVHALVSADGCLQPYITWSATHGIHLLCHISIFVTCLAACFSICCYDVLSCATIVQQLQLCEINSPSQQS